MNRKLAIAFSILLLTPASLALSQERKLKREDLPPAVQKTVDEQSVGATVRGFATELENGRRLYEAELVVNGHSKDISMTRSGAIVEVEEEAPLESLSVEVREGLKLMSRGGAITKVESLTKNGKLVAYEAVVKRGARRSEIQVDPNGKKLIHPE